MRNAMKQRLTRAAVTLLVGIAAAGAAVTAPAAPITHTVNMDGTAFVPETITVHKGDRVVWVNKDPFPHTATSQKAGFDSKTIAPNKSWRYIVHKAGKFTYVCKLHPTMTGTLIVE